MAWLYVLFALMMVGTGIGLPFEDDCHTRIRLGILLDVSNSYRSDVPDISEFVDGFLSNYRIEIGEGRLAVITYANKPTILFNFGDIMYQNVEMAKRTIIARIQNVTKGGQALTEKALMTAHDSLFDNRAYEDKPRVLVVFTGGKTPNPHLYKDIVAILTEQGVNIVAVSWDKDEAALIAGKRGHAIYVENAADAISKLPLIVKSTCILNGGYSEWSMWGECDVTCGGGKETRSRECTNPPPTINGIGKSCNDLGPAIESRDCNNQGCGDVDGGYTDWTPWSACSHTCGAGTKVRQRLCVNPPQQNNGAPCDVIGPAKETMYCNTVICKGLIEEPCDVGLDLVIMVDQSWSVTKNNLQALVHTFLPAFIGLFDVSSDKTHIGITRFAKSSHIEFSLADNRYHDTTRAITRLNIFHSVIFANTRIDHGLTTAADEMFTLRSGDRPSKQNVLVVCTDGRPFPPSKHRSFNETIPPLASRKNVHIVAVGYGVRHKIRPNVLHEIAGDNFIVMGKRSTYPTYAQAVKDLVCAVDGGYTVWSTWSLCSVSCGKGAKSRSRTCTAPPKRKGGKDCVGPHFEAMSCMERPCPSLPPECKSLDLDLAIILDGSEHLGPDHFLYAKEFAEKLLNLFDIGSDKTRISLVGFDNQATEIVSFSNLFLQHKETLTNVIRSLVAPSLSGKRFDRALQFLAQLVFTRNRGDRPDVPNSAVFITDGLLSPNVDINITSTLEILKNRLKVNLVTVSSGTEVNEDLLYEVAGPKMVLTTSFQDMLSRVEEVASLTCTLPVQR